MRQRPTLKQSLWVERNFLVGIRRREWLQLRAVNAIDGAFAGRAAMLGLFARLNEWAAAREAAKFGAAIAATAIHPEPIFLLGHWRSGTTHLHQLLGLDRRFGYVSTLQAIHPRTSLVTGLLFRKRGLRKRPMDNVHVGSDTPQEDEFAIGTHSLISSHLGFAFPRASEFYDRFLTLESATPEEHTSWRDALLWTMKKATWLAGGRPLVMKSPQHTGRVRLLLELFPRARFVFIHRHPYDVMRSSLALNDAIGWNSYLQVPTAVELERAALRRYGLMFSAFFREVGLIPAGRYCEVSYGELADAPVKTLAKIYDRLSLPAFAAVRGVYERRAAEIRGYVRSKHPPLAGRMQETLRNVAAESMERWGYRSATAGTGA